MTQDPISNESPKAVLASLADADSRAILENTVTTARSVPELVDRCHIPTATAYRKVRRLTEIGLLEEHVHIRASGKNVSKYRLRVPAFSVTISGTDGIEFDALSDTGGDREWNTESRNPLVVEEGELTTDGGSESPITATREQRRLGKLFIDVTGTKILVDEQDAAASSQAIRDDDSISISEYVARMVDNDGLEETIDEFDTEGIG